MTKSILRTRKRRFPFYLSKQLMLLLFISMCWVHKNQAQVIIDIDDLNGYASQSESSSTIMYACINVPILYSDEGDVTIYPNPAVDNVHIAATFPAELISLTILDSNGIVVFQNPIMAGQSYQANISSGAYTFQVYTISGVISEIVKIQS